MVMLEVKGSVRLGQYLKNLRVGYGYSLRKVEEKAQGQGGDIDNSQLSRYEKGLCFPSFDKLRTLARIYNVPIQAFSDVVDLEEIEKVQPILDNPEHLLQEAHREFQHGGYDQAFLFYQKARSMFLAQAGADNKEFKRKASKAWLGLAVCLYRMGKVSLSEYETRLLLRNERDLDQSLVVHALLQLSNTHVAFGDLLLAEMEARRSLEMATALGDSKLLAFSHHSLGRIFQEKSDLEPALHHFHEALTRYRAIGDVHEALKVKLNLGPLYAGRGQFREGVRLLREARDEAKSLGHRWTVASACAWLAEIHFRRGDFTSARQFMRESNSLANGSDNQYFDILFLNAYYLWKIALSEGNSSEAKMALGRLKFLRPSLEQNLPEVRDFDRVIEKGGA